jgi:hypothetical protein
MVRIFAQLDFRYRARDCFGAALSEVTVGIVLQQSVTKIDLSQSRPRR